MNFVSITSGNSYKVLLKSLFYKIKHTDCGNIFPNLELRVGIEKYKPQSLGINDSRSLLMHHIGARALIDALYQ